MIFGLVVAAMGNAGEIRTHISLPLLQSSQRCDTRPWQSLATRQATGLPAWAVAAGPPATMMAMAPAPKSVAIFVTGEHPSASSR